LRPVLESTNGLRGAYLSLNENNPAQLELRFEVCGPPIYTVYAPKNRVTVLRLEPGATNQEKILLQSPLKDTKPPWGEWQDTQSIDLTNIQQVIARVGVLPDDPAIYKSLGERPFTAWSRKGKEWTIPRKTTVGDSARYLVEDIQCSLSDITTLFGVTRSKK
jgi:hypothetical protein